MQIELRRKIAFALLMGVVTTGLISFAVLALNLGIQANLVSVWLRSWALAYLIVIPAILLIGPRVQAFIDRAIH